MKAILLISIGLIALPGSIYCQVCPKEGLKIQSAACESPKNLRVHTVTCPEMEVRWQGNKNQAYIVKSISTDPASKEIFETDVSKILCDNYGACGATIPVKEGTNVRWSVEAVCSERNATLYSAKVNGPDSYIPVCQKIPDSAGGVHVYPNPATAYLVVEYSGKVADVIEFRIYDITGKKVFVKSIEGKSVTNNRFQLDLRNFLSGVYLLEAYNGTNTDQARFVFMRNHH